MTSVMRIAFRVGGENLGVVVGGEEGGVDGLVVEEGVEEGVVCGMGRKWIGIFGR